MKYPSGIEFLPSNANQTDNVDKHFCVGVVGLGHMGSAFANNIIDDGYNVVVFDEELHKLKEYAPNARKRSISEFGICDIIFSSLPDDSALTSVAEGEHGLLAVMKPGAVHVSTSTVSPQLSQKIEGEHKSRRQGYVACTALGNPDMAKAREVFLIVAGLNESLSIALPVIEKLGRRVFLMGDDPGVANLMKLAANVMTATTLQSMAEVMALLRKGGIQPELAFDVLTNSLFDSRVHKTYGGKILRGHYRPAGMVTPLALKDMRLALAEAERNKTPMPFTSIVRDRLVSMLARGWDDLDWSALGLLGALDAGLPPPSDFSDVA